MCLYKKKLLIRSVFCSWRTHSKCLALCSLFSAFCFSFAAQFYASVENIRFVFIWSCTPARSFFASYSLCLHLVHFFLHPINCSYWVHANVAVRAHTWNRQVVLISMYLRLARKSLCFTYVIRWTRRPKTTKKKSSSSSSAMPEHFILFRCFVCH